MAKHHWVTGATWLVASVIMAAGLFSSRTALAQSAAAAEALFNEGRSLMDAGKYDQACIKLKESNDLDPASGTLINLGLCYEKQGKTASAWVAWKEAASTAARDNRPKRASFAKKHYEALEATLSRLVIEVTAQPTTDGLAVTLDGHPMGPGTWGVALPVDPGEHVVSASAPGRKAWSQRVVVGDKADHQKVLVPALEPASAAGSPQAGTATPAPTEHHAVDETSSARPSSEHGSSTVDMGAPPAHSSRATWGYIVGSVGVLALGAGGYFGWRASSTWKTRNEHCDGDYCDDEGMQAGQDADTAAYLSDVGFGVGLVGVGVGTFLLLTAPSEQEETVSKEAWRVTPVVGRSGAGLSLGGAW